LNRSKRISKGYFALNRIQQLQQQIEAWQALLKKLGRMAPEDVYPELHQPE
jgi:Tfp pilus assembly protein PilN